MATPQFNINAPDPGASQWGPEISKTRDNLVGIMIHAASTGQDLPDWNSTWTYGGGGGSYNHGTNKSNTAGARSGNGEVKITY